MTENAAATSVSTAGDTGLSAGARIFVVVLFILFIVAGIATLDSRSLWTDEIQTGYVTLQPTIVSAVRFSHKNLPGSDLYGVIVWFFVRAGGSDFNLRLPALIFAVLALGSALRFFRRVLPGRVALFAFTLFAMSPFVNYYAREARGYSLLLFLSLEWFLLMMDAADGKKKSIILHIAIPALIIYTHLMGSIAVLTGWIYLFFAERAARNDGRVNDAGGMSLFRIVGFSVVGMALYLPSLIATIHVGAQESGAGASNLYATASLPMAVRFLYIATSFLFGNSSGSQPAIIGLLTLAGLAMAAWGAMCMFRAQPAAARANLIFMIVPVVILLAIGIVFRKVFSPTMPRYIIFAMPSILVFLVYGFVENARSALAPFVSKEKTEFKGCSTTFAGSLVRLALSAATGAILIGWVICAVDNAVTSEEPWRQAYQRLEEMHPTEVFAPGTAFWNLEYYNRARGGNVLLLHSNDLQRAIRLFAQSPETAFASFSYSDPKSTYLVKTNKFLKSNIPETHDINGRIGQITIGTSKSSVLLNEASFRLYAKGTGLRGRQSFARCGEYSVCRIDVFVVGPKPETYEVVISGGRRFTLTVDDKKSMMYVGKGRVTLGSGGRKIELRTDLSDSPVFAIKRLSPAPVEGDPPGAWLRKNGFDWIRE